MRTCRTIALIALSLLPLVARAQHKDAGGAAPRSATAPKEASQYDFLIGQWELTVVPKVSGLAAKIHGVPKLVGTWKAWRAFDGWGVEDEMRIVDASGNPNALAHAMRFYDASTKKWTQSLLDVYRARLSTGSSEWKGNLMEISGEGTDQEGRPYIGRTRFYDITATTFRYRQDRSFDSGKTWTEGILKIDAKRVSAVAPR